MKKTATILFILAISAVLAVTSCSSPEKEYQLEYKYQKGDKLEYLMSMDATMEVSEGGEQHQGSNQYSMVITQEITDIDEEGRYKVKSSMDQFKMINEMDGEKIEVPDMFGNLEFTVTMDKFGKTYSFEGLNMDMMGMGIPSTMDFDSMLENSNPALPDHPVKVGDVWENSMQVPVPGTQDIINATSVMKLEGIEEMDGQKVARISTVADIPLEVTYNLREMMEGMGQSVPSSEGMSLPDMTMKITGHEKVSSISYMTLEKGVTLLTEGDINMEINMVTLNNGSEENSIDMTMTSTIKVELKR